MTFSSDRPKGRKRRVDHVGRRDLEQLDSTIEVTQPVGTQPNRPNPWHLTCRLYHVERRQHLAAVARADHPRLDATRERCSRRLVDGRRRSAGPCEP